MDAAKRKARSEDKADLVEARKDTVGQDRKQRSWIHSIGPGLITGAADDDPSGVGTYSADGAQFGYSLLWLVLASIPLMIVVQEMCGRAAAVTGSGLAQILKRSYPKWLLHSCLVSLMIANIFNIYADLNVMAASANLMFRLPMWVGLAGFTIVLCLSQIFIPYRQYARLLKWLCVALLGYVAVAFMPGCKVDWSQVAGGLFHPHLEFNGSTTLAIVAFLGTTISPYLFFWQAGETVEEVIAEGDARAPGQRTTPTSDQEIRMIRADTSIGMAASQIVAFFIMISAIGTLHASGQTQINTAQDAAKALSPLGPWAVWIFSVCIISTGLLAIPTLGGSVAYCLAETVGWRYGFYRRFSRAKRFYLTVAGTMVLSCALNFVGILPPVKALVYSAAVNGVLAPPLIIVLLLICNNKAIMGNRTNSLLSNSLGWFTVVAMGSAALYFLIALATGATQ